MSDFYPLPFPVPDLLETTAFKLLPLQPKHLDLDYEAVMASQTLLHRWGGHGWPADDFSPAENLEDLEWHWREHQARIAFTYTVLSVDAQRCLGCVYIKSIADVINEKARPPWLKTDAMVRFWGREGAGIDTLLLHALCDWFSKAWHFTAVLFHTSIHFKHQVQLFEGSHLVREGEIQLQDRGGQHLLYRLYPGKNEKGSGN